MNSNPIGSTNISWCQGRLAEMLPATEPHFFTRNRVFGWRRLFQHGSARQGSVYKRDSNGKYHKCDPRGNYSRDTTFVLRYTAEGDRRVWETLPLGIDHTTARRMAMERELELYSPPTVSKTPAKPKPLPGFTKIRDAADKYSRRVVG